MMRVIVTEKTKLLFYHFTSAARCALLPHVSISLSCVFRPSVFIEIWLCVDATVCSSTACGWCGLRMDVGASFRSDPFRFRSVRFRSVPVVAVGSLYRLPKTVIAFSLEFWICVQLISVGCRVKQVKGLPQMILRIK